MGVCGKSSVGLLERKKGARVYKPHVTPYRTFWFGLFPRMQEGDLIPVDSVNTTNTVYQHPTSNVLGVGSEPSWIHDMRHITAHYNWVLGLCVYAGKITRDTPDKGRAFSLILDNTVYYTTWIDYLPFAFQTIVKDLYNWAWFLFEFVMT